MLSGDHAICNTVNYRPEFPTTVQLFICLLATREKIGRDTKGWVIMNGKQKHTYNFFFVFEEIAALKFGEENFTHAVITMPPILSLTVCDTVAKSSPANKPTALMYTLHLTVK